jgi:predicted amidohydrolase
MKVGLFQFDVVQGQPAENLRRICDGTRQLEVDLLVLPELCSSGYLLTRDRAAALAIELPGPELVPFFDLASRLDACIIAGVIEKADGCLFNSAVVVGPEGWIGSQRKLHITQLEQPLFRPGRALETFCFRKVSFGILTCFDAWFPEAARDLARQGAQLLCQPAAFGGERTLDIMRVRSLENGVFSATANRIGTETRGELEVSFCGKSQVVDCQGDVVAQAGPEPQTLVTDLDLQRANVKAAPMCSDLAREWERYYS